MKTKRKILLVKVSSYCTLNGYDGKPMANQTFEAIKLGTNWNILPNDDHTNWLMCIPLHEAEEIPSEQPEENTITASAQSLIGSIGAKPKDIHINF